jgi:YidC/Oxa1 family membrane protein insertase
MDNQRLILFVVLGLLLLMLWQSWVDYSNPQTETAVSTESTPVSEDKQAIPSTPELAIDESTPSIGTVQPTKATASGQRVMVETDLLKVELNTLGAGINKVWLKNYSVDIDTDELFQLMSDEGEDIFTAQSGLLVQGREFPTHKTIFTSAQQEHKLVDGKDKLNVEFLWNSPDGISYKKIYTFHRDSYSVDISFQVFNTSSSLWSGYQYNQFKRTAIYEQSSLNPAEMIPSYIGGAIYDKVEKYQKVDFQDMLEANFSTITDNGWVGMLQHYFVGAWILEEGKKYEIFSNVLNGRYFFFGYKTLQPVNIQPGSSGSLSSRLFIGPKETDLLKAEAPGLELTVDYGWLTPISEPLFWLLSVINKFVGNWGWAIIILTILIKIVFYPLSAASHKSMANMRKVGPRIQTLKERYGDDKQKLNAAMMKLYKEEKINPLGGCLPILIQIPVFIALYWALLESVELRQAPWILWIKDLSAPDPYFVLPILMGVSMLVQQLISTVAMDPMQKKIMMALPVVFTFFFLFFPSGLVLYWTVNNLLTILQQHRINKKMGV